VKKLLGDSKPILNCRTLKIPNLEKMPVISEPIYGGLSERISERKLVQKQMPSARHFIPKSYVHRRIQIRSMAIGQLAYICGGLLHGGLGRICWFISLKIIETSFHGHPNNFSAKSV